MTTLILIRHGQSLSNNKKTYTGQADIDLSGLGYKQAEMAADYITSNFKIDAIYSSDLVRAYHTAESISKRLNIDIIKDKNLREIFGGAWDNMPYDEIAKKYPDSFDVWLHDTGNSKCPNGETMLEFSQRIMSELTKIAEKNDSKTIVISTHATPIRVFQTICTASSLAKMKDIRWVPNASTTIAEYKNGKFELTMIGNDSYLGDISTNLPDNV